MNHSARSATLAPAEDGRLALRLLLHSLGLLFALASRTSDRFRAQVSRGAVVEIRTRDGVAHHFSFGNRSASGRSGRAAKPDVALVFATASQGFATLSSAQGSKLLMAGLLDGTIAIEGNVPLLLWFQGLAGMVAPIARPPALAAKPPHGYVAPTASAGVARRITRQPVADALDPAWTSAAAARAKLLMPRAAAGEPLPPF